MKDQSFLDKLGGLTPDGKNWLTLALDPFHDTEVSPAGYPDMDTSNIIVQTIKTSVLARAPSNVGSNETWDLHVSLAPTCCSSQGTEGLDGAGFGNEFLFATRGVGEMLVPTPTPFVQQIYEHHDLYLSPTRGVGQVRAFDMASVCAIKSGQQPFPDGVVTPDITNAVIQTPSLNTSASGRRRLVALGCEIHDTTAEIYKQGTCTSYLIPQSQSEDAAISGLLWQGSAGRTTVTDGTTTANMFAQNGLYEEKFKVFTCPPANIAQAMAYEGSRQWEAKEGCYLTARFHSQNPLQQNDFNYLAYTVGDVNRKYRYNTGLTDNSPQANCLANISRDCTVVEGTNPYGIRVLRRPPSGSLTLPIHTSGAIFTGLHQSASFNVTFKAIWELSPSIADATGAALVYSTRPSPPHDPLALKLYQETVTRLPVAVPVNQNPDGEFWSTVVDGIKRVARGAGNVLQSIPHPYAQAAGAALRFVPRPSTAPEKTQDITHFRPAVKKHAPAARASSAPNKKVVVAKKKLKFATRK